MAPTLPELFSAFCCFIHTLFLVLFNPLRAAEILTAQHSVSTSCCACTLAWLGVTTTESQCVCPMCPHRSAPTAAHRLALQARSSESPPQLPLLLLPPLHPSHWHRCCRPRLSGPSPTGYRTGHAPCGHALAAAADLSWPEAPQPLAFFPSAPTTDSSPDFLHCQRLHCQSARPTLHSPVQPWLAGRSQCSCALSTCNPMLNFTFSLSSNPTSQTNPHLSSTRNCSF